MSCRPLSPLVLLALALQALPAPAAAQIHSWRDANGNLVVSNRPPGATTGSFAVDRTAEFRATRASIAQPTTPYDALIEEHAATNAVHPGLVRAVIQAESAFDPVARSTRGAMGLMQLMPATAARYGVTNAYDPAQNIRAGVAYLRDLLSRYGEDVTLALAAYNAGPGAVERYGTVPPYRETRDYVARVRTRAGDSAPPATRIYRTVEIVDGREVPRFTNRVPAGGKQP